MSKKNLIIAISAFLILVFSVGGFLVFNSQSSNKTEKISNSNSGKSQIEFIKNNETNDIKINQTGTINPKFQSSETKEKYGVDFDPCKMLTPEMTNKHFRFVSTIPSQNSSQVKGEVICVLNSISDKEIKTFRISITDNNNKIDSITAQKLDPKKELQIFKNLIIQNNFSTTYDTLLKTFDNTILINKTEIKSIGKTSTAVFMINNYKIEARFNSKEKYDDVNFENFVKEFYESIKF